MKDFKLEHNLIGNENWLKMAMFRSYAQGGVVEVLI